MTDYKVDIERETIKRKIKDVEDTIAQMKDYPTIAMVELHKLPDSLLQKLRKKIREDGGKVKILKKPVLMRVLQSNAKLSEKLSLSERPMAFIMTKWSPYELNSFFKKNRKKRAAKVGDIAPFDIIVPEGDTDLPPGPALSELKAGGVNVQIKGGKIVVAKNSTVAKAGEEITLAKVKALTSLNVMPFEVMANLMFAFDGQYSYAREILDIGDTITGDLLASYMDALNMSLNANYPTAGNSEILLQKAVMQSMNLALNAGIYSSSTAEQLLTSALRQGLALSGLEPAEKAAEPAAPEAKEKGSDAPAPEATEAKEEKK
ncbi:MAG: 50S ribosomal protein L10 [Candidatus Micrarchaeota archaeon]